MTCSFLDGPAAGLNLRLRRAPVFLRVAQSHAGKWDALDQLDDVAGEREILHVYICAEEPIRIHIKAARGSGWYALAKYKHHPSPPSQDILRDNAKWRAWTHEQTDSIPEWARRFAPTTKAPEKP